MNINQLLKDISSRLSSVSAEGQREAQLILSHLLACKISELWLYEALPEEKLPLLDAIIAGRLQREPLQYLLGEEDFMSLTFTVDHHVLIPRGDSERVVERGIDLLKDQPRPLIADICCGSGAMAVSLAYYLPQALVYGVDISWEALLIAQKNAARYALQGRVKFLQGDLLAPLAACREKFSLLISNPPYIPRQEIAYLAEEVQKEPLLALDGGDDGLAFYRRLALEAGSYLQQDGYLLLETGYNQKDDICSLLEEANWRIIETIKDYGGNHRGIIAQNYYWQKDSGI
ncbi:MAG: peptide chain release factor N(5)-glutamine methyltransferase [Clostridiales bacterium]